MKFFDRFRKSKTVDLEAQRREKLMRTGRIAEGVITDSQEIDGVEVVYFMYEIGGSIFESSEVMTEEQLKNPAKYAPGANIGIRFDPRQPGNSTLA